METQLLEISANIHPANILLFTHLVNFLSTQNKPIFTFYIMIQDQGFKNRIKMQINLLVFIAFFSVVV